MTFRTHTAFAAACLLAVLIPTSCLENEPDEAGNARRISFHIDGVQANGETKSESIEDTYFRFEVDGYGMDMSFSEERHTKSAELDNNGNPISKIYVSAIEHDGMKYYFKDSEVEIAGGNGTSSHFWPSQNLSFFAYASSKEGIRISPEYQISSSRYKGSFSYSLPLPGDNPQKDATAQPDIVFAITPDRSAGSGASVSLKFHHALSALIFKSGKMPENVFLNSITISNVYTSGNCTMIAAEDQNVEFTWDFTGKKQDGRYTEEIKENAAHGEQMGSSESTFMMLPQTMAENTELSVSFAIEGREYTLTKKFKEIISAWEPDKKYVFTIGLPEEIDVEVNDNVEGAVKSNVEIQNTGISTGYIRAAIVGFWINNKGDVTGPWSSEDGEFVWGSGWNTKWKLGIDGFYYHLEPVEAKNFTAPLFKTYTLKASTEIGTPHAFQTLELSIISQIISVNDKHLWPELN